MSCGELKPQDTHCLILCCNHPLFTPCFFSCWSPTSTMRKSMEDVWKEITHQDPNTTFSSIFLQKTPPLPPTQLPCQHGQEPHHHCNAFAFVAGPSSFCEKKMPEPSDDLNHPCRKRLIKSRESADRSRAKKQAHIHELELKLNHLMKENAKLRREQQKTWLADQLHRRKKLCRSLTAPF